MDSKATSRIVILEMVGFAAVIAVIWLDELADLPYYLGVAASMPPRVPEAWLESGLVVIVCAGVIASTIWLLGRIVRLESYIVMCAWCRRVRVDGRWITFEEYLSEKDNLQTSHGLCSACAEEQIRVVESWSSARK